jgi:hypothetical protein
MTQSLSESETGSEKLLAERQSKLENDTVQWANAAFGKTGGESG